MEDRVKRPDRTAGTGGRALLAGAIALISCWGAQGAPVLLCGPGDIAPVQDAPSVAGAGSEWRLVRQGGGFTSPTGRTGVVGNDVAWGAGRFVAVGWHGTIVHSRNGDRWQNATHSGTSQWLESVAWSGTHFVAVGLSGAVVRSSDGDHWVRARHVETSGSLQSVVWSGDAFVAVGWDGEVVHSRDGDRWEAGERPTHDREAERRVLGRFAFRRRGKRRNDPAQR